jgi:hypothetical protein
MLDFPEELEKKNSEMATNRQPDNQEDIFSSSSQPFLVFSAFGELPGRFQKKKKKTIPHFEIERAIQKNTQEQTQSLYQLQLTSLATVCGHFYYQWFS